jgi:hypothetical protein
MSGVIVLRRAASLGGFRGARQRLALLLALGSAALSCAACSGSACGAGKNCATPPIAHDAGTLGLVPLDHSAPHVVEADAACAAQSVEVQRGPSRPVDVIFVIDNSGSMSDEIAAVRHNINTDFAAIIEASGVDYRVILLSLYGEGVTDVCVEPPLAGADCSEGFAKTNSERFFHYSQEIGSNDALCQLLDRFDRSDAAKHAPNGFQAWLRPEAAKAFVIITDDNARCSYTDEHGKLILGADGADPYEDALAFHTALLAKSSVQFGGANAAYQFFSIVGLAGTEQGEPIFPYQALVPTTCSSAPAPGLSYQALSVITDALRYPVCDGVSFDAVFRVLARSVIQASQSDCMFELPAAPQDQTLDLAQVNLEYTPGDGSPASRFRQVATSDDCSDDEAFFIHDRIELCPAACRAITRDATPQLNIFYGCARAPD